MKITIVNSSSYDWVGLYIDGKLVYQDHSISSTYLLNLLKIKYEEIEIDMGDEGDMPDNLKNLKGLRP